MYSSANTLVLSLIVVIFFLFPYRLINYTTTYYAGNNWKTAYSIVAEVCCMIFKFNKKTQKKNKKNYVRSMDRRLRDSAFTESSSSHK